MHCLDFLRRAALRARINRETLRGVPWQGWQNAEVYHEFVSEHPIYRRLNEQLASMADLGRARRVLDLGCGTGATAAVALARVAPEAELIGIDASDAMVSVARARNLDPRASFAVLSAASVGELAPRRFDRVLSNAAVWQFPSIHPVLEGLANVTVRSALFVFNVPAERVRGEDAPVHPFQVALAREFERRTARPFPSSPAGLDPDGLATLLSATGFRLEARERFTYLGAQSELVELMRIPAMTAPLAPDLSWSERMQIVDRTAERIDPNEPIEVPWIYFKAIRE